MNPNETVIGLAIIPSGTGQYAVGAEFLRNGEVYKVASFVVDNPIIRSSRQLIFKVCSELLNEVDSESQSVLFISGANQFIQYRVLESRVGVVAANKGLSVRFQFVERYNAKFKHPFMLCHDAIRRRGESIIADV